MIGHVSLIGKMEEKMRKCSYVRARVSMCTWDRETGTVGGGVGPTVAIYAPCCVRPGGRL